MIKKRIRQLIKLAIDIIVYLRMKSIKTKNYNGTNTIFVDFVNPNLYHRYFYNLIYTLKIGGYNIVYPINFSKFRNLRNGDVYLALLFEKNLIDIKQPKNSKNFIRIADEMFSADYYKTLFQNNNDSLNSFHIPMSFHPYMYSKKIWNATIQESDKLRINSLFSFGNFDREAYKTVNKSPFRVIDRSALLSFFSKKSNFVNIASKNDLEKRIHEANHNKFIFAEKAVYAIPIEKVRVYLSHFRYFLCCPGVFAPLSHNFAEALSAGCIPIIQKSYASTIYPALENKKNAFIFEDEDGLENLVSHILFQLSDEEYLRMKLETEKYYKAYIEPSAAAKNIIDALLQNKSPIYLNASERSVKLI